MSKLKTVSNILFPDFEALAERYQVIPSLNLVNNFYSLSWMLRQNKVIWRGSGAPGVITSENMHEKSRVRLCKLSQAFPTLIDAGFTFCIPGCISHLKKDPVPYEDIFSYRYQIWIDGNTTSFGNSGWRFFSGSTVLKEDSEYEQWYFDDLFPWLHYVPIDKGLSNLIETLIFLQDNEILSEMIGAEGNLLAQSHLKPEACYEYFFKLIKSYALLPQIERCTKCKSNL